MVEFRFEKLEAWQLALELADQIYQHTREFPDSEKYGLTSQMRRAAVSIPANIAEGSGRLSNRDKLRYVEIAYGSLMEIVSHIEIAKRQGFMNIECCDSLRQTADRLARMMSGLRNHLKDQ